MNDWLADYDQRYESAWLAQEDLSGLDAELAGMLERHPGWDGRFQNPPVPRSPALTGSASALTGRGMGSGDVEQWRSLVAAYFPADQVDMALRVMACESGGNPNAANPRSTARGLMQVMWSVWGPEYGVSEAELYIPEVNLSIAAKVYARQGWNAWTCWRR